jgi:hypothetical protein
LTASPSLPKLSTWGCETDPIIGAGRKSTSSTVRTFGTLFSRPFFNFPCVQTHQTAHRGVGGVAWLCKGGTPMQPSRSQKRRTRWPPPIPSRPCEPRIGP